MPKSKEPLEVDFAVLQFYDKVRGLLSDAGRYAHSYKLRDNLSDESTRFKVEHVLLSFYDGDMRKLNDDIHFRRKQCFKSITEINRLCFAAKVHQVKDKEALADLLLDEKRREGWRKLIKKHQENNEIVSLQTIEMEFRNKPKKAP